jgi:predicted phage baseplate assembly protein
VLRRRVATHATALARMRAALAATTTGDPDVDLALRGLARTDDPAVALLDTWAHVADVVAFYSERIAHEGYLRTATRRGSVRELARMLGYELRPGVAAQVDLAFFAQGGPGAPESVIVPAETPAQSVPRAAPLTGPPRPAELPQIFETTGELEVRPEWNVLPGVASAPQSLRKGRDHLWVRGTSTPVRPGDTVLVAPAVVLDRGRPPAESDEPPAVAPLHVVVAVLPGAGPEFVRLDLDPPIGALAAGAHTFATRGRLFGWNAPDPNLLVSEGRIPDGAVQDATTKSWSWSGFAVTSRAEPTVVELDGEHPEVLVDSWVVLRQPGVTQAFLVTAVTPDGAQRFGLSGPITRVTLAVPEAERDRLKDLDRRRATVYCGSSPLDVAAEPATAPVAGRRIVVVGRVPLPRGRRVLVRGTASGTGGPAVEAATVASCTVSPGGATMTLVTEADLLHSYAPAGLEVLGNVATAGHGESVAEVLGSGDGRVAFPTFRPRRAPLTHVRATTPDGARAELTVRVDGVAWSPVASLEQAGPTDRAYAVAHEEDGGVRILLGDGVHGARPPTGTENVRATYRVGIGEAGAVDAGQVSLLPRRPLGIREVTNPAAARDWAPAETLETARTNAPLRVRTLDRAVSVTDHEDLARGYAGVGPVRADLVWDGRVHRVVVSVLGVGATPVSGELRADLERTLAAAGDPAAPLDVLAGLPTWFGVRVDVAHDPVHERPTVVAAVTAALHAAFGPAAATLGTPVTAAGVLVTVRGVPGVAACTMPRLLPLADPAEALPDDPVPPDATAPDVLVPLPARWDPAVPPSGGIAPAQLVALAPGAAAVGDLAGTEGAVP